MINHAALPRPLGAGPSIFRLTAWLRRSCKRGPESDLRRRRLALSARCYTYKDGKIQLSFLQGLVSDPG